MRNEDILDLIDEKCGQIVETVYCGLKNAVIFGDSDRTIMLGGGL